MKARTRAPRTTKPVQPPAPSAPTLPVALEICGRMRDGFACRGVMYRPLPDAPPYCYACGSTTPGVIYVREP